MTSDSEPSKNSDLRAVDGRLPGWRGRATRQRLLECTSDLLETTSYRDLKVVDIARAANTSPGTFYQYFPDAESALLALADRLVGEGGQRLIRPLKAANWHGENAYLACEAVADAFLEFWADHSAMMAVIDLAALQGDQRFRDCRIQLLNTFTVAATNVLTQQKQAGFAAAEVDAEATAVVLVSMLSHVAAHQTGIAESGVAIEHLRDAMARVMYNSPLGKTDTFGTTI